MMAKDILYLMDMGLTIQQIADRAGRTPTAIQAEIDAYNTKQEGADV